MSTLSLSQVLNPEAGWYRGDFHAHTNASDGVYPPATLAGIARAEGLDFVAITDHNTIEALSELSQRPGLLIIPGVEVTLGGEIEFIATLSDSPAAAYARIVRNGEILAETLIPGGDGSLEYAAFADGDYPDSLAATGEG